MGKLKPVMCALVVFLVATPSFAEHRDSCTIDIERGVEVKKTKIRVFDKDKTLFEIDSGGQLWIEGEYVALNSKQQALTSAYYQEVQIAVPELIEMANGIVELTAEALHNSFGEAFGRDSGMTESIDRLMVTVQKAVSQSMSRRGGVYRIAADGDEVIEGAFGDEFEEEVEAIAEQALASVLVMLAKSIFSGEGDFEERMEAVGDKIETSMETHMEHLEEEIEDSTDSVCHKMSSLRQLETRMHREIPALSPYVVFK